jgi:hypothetical protein
MKEKEMVRERIEKEGKMDSKSSKTSQEGKGCDSEK